MNLLLDAHTLLFTLYEPERLSPRAASSISDGTNALFVSLASIWEIANKAASHRLPLVGTSIEPMLKLVTEIGCTILPIRQAVILSSASLPLHHLDPFDRLLVAQAQADDLTLLTKDKKITPYEVSILW